MSSITAEGELDISWVHASHVLEHLNSRPTQSAEHVLETNIGTQAAIIGANRSKVEEMVESGRQVPGRLKGSWSPGGRASRC
jgi:hypothetical protein